jgi:hypothetical protein
VQATIGDGTGTYTTVDPASAGVTIELIDDTHAVPIVIPPRDPRWILVNPRRGKYRWRGGSRLAREEARAPDPKKAPTEWAIVLQGRNLPGASALDYQSLVVRVLLGTRCAERRFHSETEPAFPRR